MCLTHSSFADLPRSQSVTFCGICEPLLCLPISKVFPASLAGTGDPAAFWLHGRRSTKSVTGPALLNKELFSAAKSEIELQFSLQSRE